MVRGRTAPTLLALRSLCSKIHASHELLVLLPSTSILIHLCRRRTGVKYYFSSHSGLGRHAGHTSFFQIGTDAFNSSIAKCTACSPSCRSRKQASLGKHQASQGDTASPHWSSSHAPVYAPMRWR
eukprot:scaffold7576_cov417-Prasinococcus_capsulatus_cf.AAC.10